MEKSFSAAARHIPFALAAISAVGSAYYFYEVISSRQDSDMARQAAGWFSNNSRAVTDMLRENKLCRGEPCYPEKMESPLDNYQTYYRRVDRWKIPARPGYPEIAVAYELEKQSGDAVADYSYAITLDTPVTDEAGNTDVSFRVAKKFLGALSASRSPAMQDVIDICKKTGAHNQSFGHERVVCGASKSGNAALSVTVAISGRQEFKPSL